MDLSAVLHVVQHLCCSRDNSERTTGQLLDRLTRQISFNEFNG